MCVLVVEVSGQARLWVWGFLGSGTGSCFGSGSVRVLTSLVRRRWVLTGLQTILVVQETCLPSQSLPVTHTHAHTHTHDTCRYYLPYVCIHNISFNDNRVLFLQVAKYEEQDRSTYKRGKIK